ncbi:MAG: tyrosine-type recombinase/integrase [Bacteroidota bacterium]
MSEQSPYKPARVVQGHRLYVEFHIYDKEKGALVRKRISGFPGSTQQERIKAAENEAKEINTLLKEGYTIGKARLPTESTNPYFLNALRYAVSIKQEQGSKRTRENQQMMMNRVFECFREMEWERIYLSDFSKAHVYTILDWIFQAYSIGNVTRNNYLSYLRAALNILVDRGHIPHNPCNGVKKLPEHAAKNVPFTKDQKQKLGKYLAMFYPDHYVYTRLMYYGFMRPVEILRLRVMDIDLENRVILVYTHMSKSKQQQPVFITQSLHPVLEAYLARHKAKENHYLFSKKFKPGPGHIHRNRFSEWHSKVLKRWGFYDGLLTGYSWKHTGVCDAYRAGVDIRAIQEQCRHHSLEMTERYLRSMGLRIHATLKKAEW